ncbi:hypothetical protein PQX77_007287 [Marasmius sp. AFHP31]|nr:hypothetical protein PQX77_007287 [Marasmius sp. AFHP31]
MSGLAPTLMVVRVAYGKSVDSVQQMVSIHVVERETQPGPSISRGGASVTGILSCPPRNEVAELDVEDFNPEKKERQDGFEGLN